MRPRRTGCVLLALSPPVLPLPPLPLLLAAPPLLPEALPPTLPTTVTPCGAGRAGGATGECSENSDGCVSDERRDDDAEVDDSDSGEKPLSDGLPCADSDTGEGGTVGGVAEDSEKGEGSWWRVTLRDGMGIVTGVRVATGDSTVEDGEPAATLTLLLRWATAEEEPSAPRLPSSALRSVPEATVVMAADGLQLTLSVGKECVQAS